MKKLISLFLSLLIVVASFAADKAIRAGIGYSDYTGLATDTINGTTTMDVVFRVDNIGHYTIGYYVEGDTTNGCSGNVTIQAQGSYDESGTYVNIGSSVTWTTTADYSGSTMLNTYSSSTTIASYTIANAGNDTTLTYDITEAGFIQSVDGDSICYVDSLSWVNTQTVPEMASTTASTQTVASQTITETVTMPGVNYRFIKILLTGLSGARVEIDKVGLKVDPITVPKR